MISLNTNYLYLQKLILSSLILDLLWAAPWLPRWHSLWLQHPLRLLWFVLEKIFIEAKIFLEKIFIEAKIFLEKIFIETKIFLEKIFIEAKIFLEKIFIDTKIFFGAKIFWRRQQAN